MKLKLLIIFFLLTSCSHFKSPPSATLNEISQKIDLTKEEKLLLDIKSILDDKVSDCNFINDIDAQLDEVKQLLISSKKIKRCKVIDELSLEKELSLLPKWMHQQVLTDLLEVNKESTPLRGKILLMLGALESRAFLKEKLLVEANQILNSKESQERLFRDFPRYQPHQESQDLFEKARDLEKARKFKSARSIYRKITYSKSETLENIVKSWDRIRLAFKLERDRANYLKETKALVSWLRRWHRNSEEHLEFTIKLARIYWTIDEFDNALKILNQLNDDEITDNEIIVSKYYFIAGIYHDMNKDDLSLFNYEKAFNLQGSFKGYEKEISWALGWVSFKNDDLKSAIKWFSYYVDEIDDEEKIKFWLARSFKKNGDHEKAADLFLDLYENDPFGFYGQIASGYLNKPLLPIRHNRDNDRESGSVTLDWLVYFDQISLAKSFINETNEVKDYLHSYYIARVYDQMIFYFFRNSGKKKDELIKKYPYYVFPLAFYDEITEFNKSKIVPNELILSIARQESAFNPHARSFADAFGLLQLIPSQASRLSKKYNIEYEHYLDLYDVSKNISLASYLLDELISHNDGNIINFLASYNAGPNALKRWREKNHGKGLFFIEDIPYKETRKYVKLIMRNMLIYKRMLGKKPFYLSDDLFNISFFTQ